MLRFLIRKKVNDEIIYLEIPFKKDISEIFFLLNDEKFHNDVPKTYYEFKRNYYFHNIHSFIINILKFLIITLRPTQKIT